MKNILKTLIAILLMPSFAVAQNPNVDVPTIHFDLIHTDLDLMPVWETHAMKGVATLTMKPHFYSQNKVVLDANALDIHAVTKNGTKLSHFQNGTKLHINLDRSYTKEEELTIKIDYTAHPDSVEFEKGDGITGDKGLYFINTDNSRKGVPMHLWTQGETQANSCWFPTFDFPAENHTQKIKITYRDDMVSLSNGSMISTTNNGDGTKTDIWEQTIPHSVYLTVLVIGDFKIVKDFWRGKEVSYYMEPKYEEMARPIFGRTPEMIEFFSNLLKVDYPWDKYSQVVVHDFVAGAMENTSAVTFNEFVQKNHRELVDENDDETIAHELFHHWFGDMVTCESWAHLTLNESFANYSEYLWHEHKDGLDEAQRYWINDFRAYLMQSNKKHEPLYRTSVEKPDDMFDVISYNKGGKILHMLRKHIGDDAFFATLNDYLVTHKYESAEVSDLRKSVEKITGYDMKWFFEQWYEKGGHPVIYSSSKKDGDITKLFLKQKHNSDTNYVYRLPLKMAIYTTNGVKNMDILFTKKKDTFEIPYTDIKAISIDRTNSFVGVINHAATPEEWIYLLKNSDQFLDHYRALLKLRKYKSRATVKEAIYQSLYSPKEGTMIQAMKNISSFWLGKDEKWNKKLSEIASTQSYSGDVKARAIRTLAKNKELDQFKSLALNALKDSSYYVEAQGLKLLSKIDSTAALERAFKSVNSQNFDILESSYKIIAKTKRPEMLKYFDQGFENAKSYKKIAVYLNYADILSLQPDNIYNERVDILKSMAASKQDIDSYCGKIGLGKLYEKYSDMKGGQAKKRLKFIKNIYKEQPDLMMGG